MYRTKALDTLRAMAGTVLQLKHVDVMYVLNINKTKIKTRR